MPLRQLLILRARNTSSIVICVNREFDENRAVARDFLTDYYQEWQSPARSANL